MIVLYHEIRKSEIPMVIVSVEQIDVNETECTVMDFQFKNLDNVMKGSHIFTVETTKLIEEIEAPESGIIKYYVEEYQKIEFGKTVCCIFEEIEEIESYEKVILDNDYENNEKILDVNVKATKKAVKKAKELGINIEEIKKDGFIKENDIINFYNKQMGGNNSNLKIKYRYDNERILIIVGGMGSGVVYDILSQYSNKEVVGIVGEKRSDRCVPDVPVISNNIENFFNEVDVEYYDSIIISSASDMSWRKRLYELFNDNGLNFTNAIHKNAIISKNVKIGDGNVIGALVCIGYGSFIGNNNWLANGVNIDHHNFLGNHNLIGPGSSTSGDVRIGNFVTIGTGVFLENLTLVEDNVKIGSGNIIRYKKQIKEGEIIKSKI